MDCSTLTSNLARMALLASDTQARMNSRRDSVKKVTAMVKSNTFSTYPVCEQRASIIDGDVGSRWYDMETAGGGIWRDG